jgi:sigma-B regulation protein RsbU (phosphoserine phosphatase)
VLSRLDAKIMHFEPGAMATAVYAVAEPPFDRLRVASAGHFLPITVGPDGCSEEIDLPVGLPLGVDTAMTRESGTVELDPGSALALFTDGLVERRTVSTPRGSEVFDTIDTALAELQRLLQLGRADAMCSRVLDAMLTLEPPSDDVALLIVRREGNGPAALP